MKHLFVLFLLACVVGVSLSEGYCGSIPDCGEGRCCSGGSYHRFCRRLADEGEPCEHRNKVEEYRVACPCKDGMFCSAINRCQKE